MSFFALSNFGTNKTPVIPVFYADIFPSHFPLQEKLRNMLNLEGLEKQMIDCLSSDARLLNDLVATKKLAELMKQFDETVERWVQGDWSAGETE